jgi:non-ribosomal peptide synthetase component F
VSSFRHGFHSYQLLTETAARQPEHDAVRLLNEALTYGQRVRLSNQVAHSLIANGVTRGDQVGIYLYKSPAAIPAIFRIMKTGASYVPVDADVPVRGSSRFVVSARFAR